MPMLQDEEVEALKARVRELEAALENESAAFDIATDTHNADMRLLDAANADRARLRSAAAAAAELVGAYSAIRDNESKTLNVAVERLNAALKVKP